MFCALEENMYSGAVRWNILYMFVRPILSVVLFKSPVSILVFYLGAISNIENVVLRSLLLLSCHFFLPFKLVNVCFKYLGPPMLSECIYNYCILLMNWHFHHYIISFFVSCDNSLFKVYFIWYGTASPALDWLPFAWNIFFHPFIFNQCLFLKLKWVTKLVFNTW